MLSILARTGMVWLFETLLFGVSTTDDYRNVALASQNSKPSLPHISLSASPSMVAGESSCFVDVECCTESSNCVFVVSEAPYLQSLLSNRLSDFDNWLAPHPSCISFRRGRSCKSPNMERAMQIPISNLF